MKPFNQELGDISDTVGARVAKTAYAELGDISDTPILFSPVNSVPALLCDICKSRMLMQLGNQTRFKCSNCSQWWSFDAKRSHCQIVSQTFEPGIDESSPRYEEFLVWTRSRIEFECLARVIAGMMTQAQAIVTMSNLDALLDRKRQSIRRRFLPDGWYGIEKSEGYLRPYAIPADKLTDVEKRIVSKSEIESMRKAFLELAEPFDRRTPEEWTGKAIAKSVFALAFMVMAILLAVCGQSR